MKVRKRQQKRRMVLLPGRKNEIWNCLKVLPDRSREDLFMARTGNLPHHREEYQVLPEILY